MNTSDQVTGRAAANSDAGGSANQTTGKERLKQDLAGLDYAEQESSLDPTGGGTLRSVFFRGIAALEEVLAGQNLLRPGCRDTQAIQALQGALNAVGQNCGAADGIWGAKTSQGVVGFQRASGLTPDGVIGSLTLSALDTAALAGGGGGSGPAAVPGGGGSGPADAPGGGGSGPATAPGGGGSGPAAAPGGGGLEPGGQPSASDAPGSSPTPEPQAGGAGALNQAPPGQTEPGAASPIAGLRTNLLAGAYDGQGAYGGAPAGSGGAATFQNKNLDELLRHYIEAWLPQQGLAVSMAEALKAAGGEGERLSHSVGGQPQWVTYFQNALITLAPRNSPKPNAWNEDADAVQRIVRIYLQGWTANQANGAPENSSVAEFQRNMGASLGNEQASESMASGATMKSAKKDNWCNQASNSMLVMGLLRNGIAVKGVNPQGPPWNGQDWCTAPVLYFIRQCVNSLVKVVLPTLKAEGDQPLKPGDMIDILSNKHKEDRPDVGGVPQSEGHRVTVVRATGPTPYTAGQKLVYVSGNASDVNNAEGGAVRCEETTVGDCNLPCASLPDGQVKVKNVTRGSQLNASLLLQNGKLAEHGLVPFRITDHFARNEAEKQKLREIFSDLPGI